MNYAKYRMQNYFLINLVVHKVTTGLSMFNCEYKGNEHYRNELPGNIPNSFRKATIHVS
jgi:hypothetical protein